jgi:hypothetical protein
MKRYIGRYRGAHVLVLLLPRSEHAHVRVWRLQAAPGGAHSAVNCMARTMQIEHHARNDISSAGMSFLARSPLLRQDDQLAVAACALQ